MSTQRPGGSPFRELVRHTLVYGSGYVTMAIASFALVPVYTRQLSPSDYGLLGLMLVLYGLASQLYDFGFTNSIGRFFFDSPEGERDTALLSMRATALSFMLVLGGVLTLVLWLPAGEWSKLLTQSSRHANLVRIVAITLYAEGLAIVPLTLIRMQERSRLFMAITVVRFLVTIVLSLLFVAGLHWGVRGALLANAASALGVLLFLLPDCLLGLKSRPSWPLLWNMLTFGVPYFPVILSSWFIEASDRYLLGLDRSHAEVGYYVLGYKVAQVMQISLAAFSMGWAPLRFKIYERDDAPEIYRQLTTYFVVASGILVVALAVFAREIVSVIAPASYSPAAKIVPLIAWAYGLSGLYLLFTTGVGVAKRTAPLAWVVTGAALVNLGINIALIPVWGMEIAAITTVLANLLMAAGVWHYSQRVYPIPYDWRRILGTTAIGAVIVAGELYLAPGQGAVGILCAAAAWVLFVLVLVKTRMIRGEDLASARELLLGLRGNLSRRPPRERLAS